MEKLVELIPSYPENYFRGSSYIVEDYEKFLNKIIKYYVDEKDLEQKNYYFKIL